jgi:thioredoxin reductase (NADPH)
MKDLIIIGAGAAGLSAAIYAARAGMDFLVLEQDGYGGGQITASHLVENYPGVPHISGEDLGEQMRQQAVDLGADITFAVVQQVTKEPDGFTITTEEETYRAKQVIAATGAVPRKLEVPGEQQQGVSYCAVCDGAFYKDKDVAVIGGGDTAVEDAIYLAGICRQVTLIHRREVFRAPATRVEQMKSLENVTLCCNRTVETISGEGKVESLVLNHQGKQEVLEVSGVFIAIGTLPETGYLQGLDLQWQEGYVVADEYGACGIPGLYVAGDIRAKRLRQVVTAVADGANAATQVIETWMKERR